MSILWSGWDNMVVLLSGLTSNIESRAFWLALLNIYRLFRRICLIRVYLIRFITSSLSAFSRRNSTNNFTKKYSKIFNQFFHKEEGLSLRTTIASYQQKNTDLRSYNSYQSTSHKTGEVSDSTSMWYHCWSALKPTSKATNTTPNAWKYTQLSSLYFSICKPIQLSFVVWYHLQLTIRS